MKNTVNSPGSLTLPQIKKILAGDSGNFSANLQAGVLYSQAKEHLLAVEHLKRALNADKKNTLILFKLGGELLAAKKPRDAYKVVRKLVELKKRDGEAAFLMYRICDSLGEFDKAQKWVDKAIGLEPENTRYLDRKANLAAISGDIEGSLAIHKQILAIDPKFPHSYWPLAMQQKHDNDSATALLEKIAISAKYSTKKEELRSLSFASGKILQDIGKYEQAFEKFEAANGMHDIIRSADRITAAHINFRETYSSSLIKEKAIRDDNEFRPIFILGLVRSGTTLTESLCGAHSLIEAAGEIGHLSDLNSALSCYSTEENGHRNQIIGLSRADLGKMANDYIAPLRKLHKNSPLITDKLPNNFLQIGLISILFPNAKIIHCRRHPMDNCLSIYSNPMIDYHKEYKSRLDTLGAYYIQYVQLMEFWKKTCPIPIHDVYYEDMVTNTQAVARGMMDYIGVDWEDGVMNRFNAGGSVKTLSLWQVRQPVFQTSKGKWLQYERQLEPLREILEDQIRDYELELAKLDSGENV